MEHSTDHDAEASTSPQRSEGADPERRSQRSTQGEEADRHCTQNDQHRCSTRDDDGSAETG
jgi:hypothetical protein